MAIPLDSHPQPETTRLPGDFQRHPNTGAPYVNHPTETTKAGRPKRAMYGRPSSLGKQIENMTNLQKWSERAVALGVMLDGLDAVKGVDLLAELVDLGPDHWTLDDPDARQLLDTIAVKAKNIAQAGIAAERGTHTHALTEDADNERDWIERARSGEDLGIPEAAQRALVAAWEQMLDAEGIEILAVETAVVDDVWRQAGTLDRIARLTRERAFVRPGGEIVTLPAGWVGVLDVKTGKLRSGSDGHPDYWHGYAVQIASYAQAVPYDTDTDTRGEWEWPIDQRWGIIAHLDVAAAIEGSARCRLVLVDLERGRQAGQLCVAAREWEKARDVFSLVADDSDVYEIAVDGHVTVDGEAASPTQPAAVESEGSTAAPSTPAAAPTREELQERYARMLANAKDTGRRDEFLAGFKALGLGPDSTIAEIVAGLDSLEPPFDPDPAPPHGIERPEVVEVPCRTVDNGDPIDDATLATLLATIKASDARAVVNGWLRQAADAGESWSPRVHPYVRQFEISRSALALAIACDGGDEYARAILRAALDDPGDQLPVGRVLGSLSIDEARAVHAVAEAFGNSLTLLFDDDGTPLVDGDVAAVLAAA